VKRCNIQERAKKGNFDLVILSKVHSQDSFLLNNYRWLRKANLIILDGADQENIYPYSTRHIKKIYPLLFKNLHQKHPYFKREITRYSYLSARFGFFPITFTERAEKVMPSDEEKLYEELEAISFSIPEKKIVKHLPDKDKFFPKHVVDEEVAQKTERSTSSKIFNKESEYYSDLKRSRFGITTKRSGWDCLRHYEIAANAAVPCFRNLDSKPPMCPPYGLNKENSISYKCYDDLMDKINSISNERYRSLQEGALKWIKNNTTRKRAHEFVEKCKKYFNIK